MRVGLIKEIIYPSSPTCKFWIREWDRAAQKAIERCYLCKLTEDPEYGLPSDLWTRDPEAYDHRSVIPAVLGEGCGVAAAFPGNSGVDGASDWTSQSGANSSNLEKTGSAKEWCKDVFLRPMKAIGPGNVLRREPAERSQEASSSNSQGVKPTGHGWICAGGDSKEVGTGQDPAEDAGKVVLAKRSLDNQFGTATHQEAPWKSSKDRLLQLRDRPVRNGGITTFHDTPEEKLAAFEHAIESSKNQLFLA